MSEQIFIPGPVGQIEIFVDLPQGEITGFAVVCHPHPLQGGNPQHKVPTLLAQIFVEQGYAVYRPNFRGSGQSAGVHDDGFGETDDILLVINHLKGLYPDLPFYAGGFSFGAHVLAKCQARLDVAQQPRQLILCGLPTGMVSGLRDYSTPAITGNLLFLHGEQDDITLLSDLIAWAAPQKHPITILPGANHFFTGYLKQLRHEIKRFLLSPVP